MPLTSFFPLALDSFTQTEKGSQTDVLRSRDLTDSCDGNKNTLGGLIVNTAVSWVNSRSLKKCRDYQGSTLCGCLEERDCTKN